jgi:hypothetical protein
VWQLTEMRVSADLERAAYAAGVPMPRPAEPSGPAAGLWTPIGSGGIYVRVSQWVNGVSASARAANGDLGLARWLGHTLALIARLDLPADHTADAAYPIHRAEDWPGWLADAVTAGVMSVAQARDVLPAVTDATALIRTALAEHPAFRLAHRDAGRRNILLTRDGPCLIDFDHAGPEVPWWEFTHHAFDLASPDLGAAPADRDTVRAALAAYTSAGGSHGPANPSAFAGVLRSQLGFLAYSLWIATGHRAATSQRRQESIRDARRLATNLAGLITEIGTWSDLLR